MLLDDYAVAKTTKLAQRFFPAKRHPSNPVMKQTKKWEGICPSVWGKPSFWLVTEPVVLPP